jgi:FKBP-type peptidyl-prolyl cis-trans isomerase SlyD
LLDEISFENSILSNSEGGSGYPSHLQQFRDLILIFTMSDEIRLHHVTAQCIVALTWVMKDSLGQELDVLDEPTEFLLGGNDLLAKIEEALIGKVVNEVLELTLEPQDAFGDYVDKLVYLAPRDQFPEQLEEGMLFEGLPPGCNPDAPKDVIYHVTDVYPEHVILDGNHPLAGMQIRLRLKINEIREATADEVGRGTAGIGFFKMEASHSHAHDHDGQGHRHLH